MSDYISASSFAKVVGVSAPMITKAIQQGRISAKKINGRWLIDKEKATVEWSANADTSYHDIKKIKNGASNENAESMIGVPSYTKSRSIKEAYAARIKKIEYEQLARTIVNADQVRRDGYAAGKLVQQKMLAIPDRLAGQLAGMTEVAAIKRVLVDEIRYALSEVADD
jgi:hypothetical protein